MRMKKMNRSINDILACIVFTFLTATTLPTQALAGEPAFVSRIGGSGVTLSRGEATLPIGVQTLLSRGDRVTAPAGSSVEVTYLEDGCILKAANGRSITVSDTSPCAAPEAARSEAATQAQLDGQPATDIVPVAAQPGSAQVVDATGPLARANLGQGLQDVRPGMVLKPGDTVFAGQNSTITLQFTDAGCSYTLPAETYLQIGPSPPCVPSERAAQPEQPSRPAPQAQDDDYGLALAALVVVGGGAAAAGFLLASGEDDDDDDQTPVTPN